MVLDFYKNRKIFITGFTGFKGSWLCKVLEYAGSRVSGYSLPLEGDDHFSNLNISGDFTLGDIRKFTKLKSTLERIEPELVIHFAAQPLVLDSYSNPMGTFDVNVMGTATLLEACRGIQSIRGIICITSDKCYENKEWDWGYREIEPMGGYDPYSASKGCAELLIASYRRSFFPLNEYDISHKTLISSARAGNVIGGGDWSKDRIIPDIIRSVKSDIEVQVRSPHSIRPWQHVLDCLRGYLLLGEKLLGGNVQCADAWNFGPEDSDIMSVHEVLLLAKNNWEKISFTINENNANVHEARLLKLDSSKARNLLKWSPKWNSSEAIKRTVNWYREFLEKGKLNTSDDIKNFFGK